MGKCQAAPSTLTPSHLSGEATSMKKSLAKRTKRHRSCQVTTPSFEPFSLSRRGPFPLLFCPPFLEQKTWRQIKPETWGQVFCSWKASRTRLNTQIKPETWRQVFYSCKASRTRLNISPSPSPQPPDVIWPLSPPWQSRAAQTIGTLATRTLIPANMIFWGNLIV